MSVWYACQVFVNKTTFLQPEVLFLFCVVFFFLLSGHQRLPFVRESSPKIEIFPLSLLATIFTEALLTFSNPHYSGGFTEGSGVTQCRKNGSLQQPRTQTLKTYP